MTRADLEQIAARLESPNSAERMVALASLRDVPAAEALPLIEKVLDDGVLQIRSMAVFALGVKATTKSYEILTALLEADPDYGIRADAAGALGYLEDPRAFEALARAFYEDTEWLVRFSAVVSLGNLKDPRSATILRQALKSKEVVMQQAAIAALGEIGCSDALDEILAFVQAEDWLVRQRLAEALGCLPSERSLAALKFMNKDSHPQVSAAAKISLARLQST